MVRSDSGTEARASDADPDPEIGPEEGLGSGLAARIGRFAGPALGAVAVVLTHPACLGLAGLSADQSWVLGMLVLMATWWVTLAVEPALTGLVPVLMLTALGLGRTSEVLGAYANEVLFLFGGGALIALALERTGVSGRFASALVGLAGTSPMRVLAAIMVASALLSAFVSNLATAATMLPLALALGARAARGSGDAAAAGRFSTSLLLGVAFGSSIGGALTVIGSPPNPIAVDWLNDNGVAMDFQRWLKFSVPAAAVFLPIAIAVLGLWLFPARGVVVPREDGGPRTPLGRDAIVALVVFVAAVALWSLRPQLAAVAPGVLDGTIAVAAATALFLAPSATRPGRAILVPADFGRVPWRVLVLFGGGIALADAMGRTGLSTRLGEVIAAAGTLPSIATLAILVTTLVLASEIASNTALAAMAVPIVGALAPGLGVAPEQLVIPAVFAASWAFAMPVGTPPNALVFASGRIQVHDMMRAGIVLDLIAIAVIVTMARLIL